MSNSNYQNMWLPVGSRQITIEDVKRWRAMEARLDYAIERANKLSFSYEEYNVLRDFLKYIKEEPDAE